MKYPDITLGRVEAVWNKLGGEEGVQRFLAGHAEVVVKQHAIDCDVAPYLPSGWSVEEHQKGGQFVWDPSAVTLYLSQKQQNGNYIVGHKLRKELANKPVLNANVLDYLLKNPHLIPEEWKGKYVFFWGTIYRHSSGYLYVRYLYWHDGRWLWNYGWLGDDWSGDYPAAVRAS